MYGIRNSHLTKITTLKQNHQKSGFIKGRLKGGVVAQQGAFKFVTTEHSGMVQIVLAILLISAGFYYHISTTEWMFSIIVLAMVLTAEALNTAIEKLCDFVHEDYHEKIGFIKDIAAGGVWFSAIAALVIELIIFYPKVFG